VFVVRDAAWFDFKDIDRLRSTIGAKGEPELGLDYPAALLRGALLVRIALGLLARGIVFLLLRLLLLRMARCLLLVGLIRSNGSSEAGWECHDGTSWVIVAECHLFTVRSCCSIT
jgi:hypothetical protein